MAYYNDLAEVEAAMDDGRVTGIVILTLDDLMAHDYEAVMDLLSEGLIGSPLLADIVYEVAHNYTAEALADDEVALRVWGDPTVALEALS